MAFRAFPSLSYRTTLSDGTTYAYVHVPATQNRATFLLLHGFPSSCFDWRHQVRGLAELGYGVLAPDLLGYGDTDKPDDLAAYKFKSMAAQVAELVTHQSLGGKVVGVAHDWGSGLLSRLANYYAELFLGFVFVAAPYMNSVPFDLAAASAMTTQAFGHSFFGYWEFFNEEDASGLCDRNNTSVTCLVYPSNRDDIMTNLGPPGKARELISSGAKSEKLPDLLDEAEVQIHNQILEAGGYTGPLNWEKIKAYGGTTRYKAAVRGINDEDNARIEEASRIVHQPILYVHSDESHCEGIAQQVKQNRDLKNVNTVRVEGCGHWVQLEKWQEVLEILVTFAEGL